MGVLIVKRVGQLLLLLLGISFIVFMSMHIAPGDPASLVAGPTATAEEVENIRANLGLDRPILVQYVDYLKGIVQGDLGTSFQTKQPVSEMLFSRFPNTLTLAIASIIIAIVVGVATGIISAIRHNTWVDGVATTVSLAGISIPNFWLGAILILVFAVELQWLPVGGLTEPIWTIEGLKQIILPAVTLATGSAAMISRMSRSSMLEVVRSDYIRTARAKGVKERTVVLLHCLKNAIIPVITVIGMNFGLLLGGAIITEQVFAINGIGRLVVEAISSRDFPIVQGAVLLISAVFVVINLIVDIIYLYVDPRISYE